MGYPALSTAASLQFGVPALTQTNFLVENALGRLLESALPGVRATCKVMDDLETKLVEAQDRLAATALGELKLRENEPDMLEAEYRRWGYRLADDCGCPIYPYSRRYQASGGNAVVSVPVRHE